MSIELFTLVYFGSLLVCLAVGMPISGAFAGIAVIGGLLLQGDSFFPWLVYRAWGLASNFSFIAVCSQKIKFSRRLLIPEFQYYELPRRKFFERRRGLLRLRSSAIHYLQEVF